MILIENEENNQNNKISKNSNALKKKIKRKLLRVVLPCILILVLVSACGWFIFMDEGIWDEDEKGRPSTYTKSAVISGTEGITVDKKQLIYQALLDLDFTEEEVEKIIDNDAEIVRILKMNEKLNRIVTNIETCTHAEILWCINDVYAKYLEKPEDLQTLLDAELITQYPKIDGLSKDKLNGIIEFERYQTDVNTSVETRTILKYISREQFTQEFNAYQQNGDTSVFLHFTLDDEGNVVIATWMREEGDYYSNNTDKQTDRKKIREGMNIDKIKAEVDGRYNENSYTKESITADFVEYTIVERTIYYKQMVQKYTLPFEFLWSLLVMGESDEFVLNLADLAYDAEIKIGIFDNINKTVTTDTEKYTEEFRTRTETYEKEEGAGDYSMVSENPSHGSVGHVEISDEGSEGEWNIEIHDYEHRNIITTYVNTQQVQVIYADVWAVEVLVPFKNTITQSNDTNLTTEEDGGWDGGCTTTGPNSQTRRHADTIDANGNQQEGDTYTVYIITKNYSYKRTINKSNESKFDLTISQYQTSPALMSEKTDIAEDTGPNFVKFLRADHNAYTLLTEPINKVWLCDMLAENADTVNMIDLAKYLLYKARYPDERRVMFDAEDWIPNENNSSTGNSGSSSSSGGLTFDFQSTFQPPMMNVSTNDYIVQIDNSNSALVINDVATLQQAFSAYSGSSEIIRYADTFLRLQQQYKVNAVFAAAVSIKETSAGRNGHATDGKNNWFNIECRCGNSSHGRFETYNSPEESIEAFYRLIANGTYYFKQGRYSVQTIGIPYCENAEKVWIPDVLSYMSRMFAKVGITSATSSGEAGPEIISIAKTKLGCPYVWGAEGPNQFDCSGFTQWCYKQVGISIPRNSSSQKQGATNIVPVSEARVGDILWREGHVGIYIGNGQYIHSPHTGDVVKISYGVQSFTYALQY